MINSTRVAYEFDSLLPVHMRPESTEGYEGFNHLHSIQGTCEKQLLNILFVTMTYNKQINNAKTLKTLQSS